MTEKEMIDNANKKLRPCPFCGGKAEIKWDRTAEAWEERGFYKVYCTDCITIHYNYFFTIDDAVARWNERYDGSEVENNIDAQPVKHVKWQKQIKNRCLVFRCSKCKLHFDYEFKFCPNCGAYMRGGSGDA